MQSRTRMEEMSKAKNRAEEEKNIYRRMLEQARDRTEITPGDRRDITAVMLEQAFGGNGDTFEIKFMVGSGGELEIEEGEGAGGLHGLLSKFISRAGGDASGEDDADEDD